jgi:hypothetical protein
VEARRAVADVGPLLAFRRSSLRGRSRAIATYGFGVIGLVTVLASWLPAYLPAGDGRRTDVISLLPSALLGVLVIALVSAAASGGGRELVSREQAVAFPVSPTTDHLGALLMAPLNIAWLLQSWTLLGAMAYVAGAAPGLVLTQLMVVAWLVTATALAQLLGWGAEWLRRRFAATWVTRLAVVALAGGAGYAVAADLVLPVLQRSPTLHVVVAALQGRHGPSWFYLGVLAALVLLTAAAVVTGARVAGAVARRPARDELRLESSMHPARSNPASELAAMMRTDRVGIWRSVPLRRGLLVLVVMPGVVAVAGDLQWEMLTILPGLVASGGALLFGVNSWCLDGRGALWRDSLPVDPRLVFCSRALVLAEVLLVATVGTVLLATLRAGAPSAAELAAVVCGTLVVVLQVVSASLRWSVGRPFAVDLRSARATPAPPLVMVGYSARLALSTTLVGLLFSGLARLSWEWPVLVALPLVLVSLVRLLRTADGWADPQVRSRVVAAVAS